MITKNSPSPGLFMSNHLHSEATIPEIILCETSGNHKKYQFMSIHPELCSMLKNGKRFFLDSER